MAIKISKTKQGISFKCSGSLEKNIYDANKLIRKAQEETPMLKAIYEKAKKEYENNINRISNYQDFIKLAEDKLKEKGEENVT